MRPPPALTRGDQPADLRVGERVEVQLNDHTWSKAVVARFRASST